MSLKIHNKFYNNKEIKILNTNYNEWLILVQTP